MSTWAPSVAGPVPLPGHDESPFAEGVRRLASAVGRFEFLVAVLLFAVITGLLLDIASALGYPAGTTESGPVFWGVRWPFGAGTLLAVILGVVLAILVIISIVYAVRGFIEWRRAIWRFRVVAARPPSTPETQIARQSLEDAHLLVFCFVGVIAVAIGVGMFLGLVDAALTITGAPLLSSAVFTVVEGVATGAVIVLAYYYGTRHLLGVLRARLPGDLLGRSLTAQNWVLAGAVIGWIGSFSSIYWPLEVVSVAGAACVLYGVHQFTKLYEGVVSRPLPPAPFGQPTGVPT